MTGSKTKAPRVSASAARTAASEERPEKRLFYEYLRRKGLKRTAQRDLILETFLESEKHITSEELYRKVRERDPTVGFTTVYRTLKLLTECGIARSMQLGDRYTHYERGLDEQHHDHLICIECGGGHGILQSAAGEHPGRGGAAARFSDGGSQSAHLGDLSGMSTEAPPPCTSGAPSGNGAAYR